MELASDDVRSARHFFYGLNGKNIVQPDALSERDQVSGIGSTEMMQGKSAARPTLKTPKNVLGGKPEGELLGHK